MMHVLEDGRCLMALYNDLNKFFMENNIVGKTIKEIVPYVHNYMIQDMDEIDNILELSGDCGIDTDDKVCFVFDDDTNLEIEFIGDGPIILGYNTANLQDYPKYDGKCYSLMTVFQYCIGYSIVGVHFEKTNGRMTFPKYDGIDLSFEDDGIKEIRFALNGGTTIRASGVMDFFRLEHMMEFGGDVQVRYADLIAELDADTQKSIFGEVILENLDGFYKSKDSHYITMNRYDSDYEDVINKYGVSVVRAGWGERDGYLLIDSSGEVIPGTWFRYINHFCEYEDRYLEISNVDPEEDNNIGLYDTKERKIFLKPQYANVFVWSEDYIEIHETGPYGCTDTWVRYINSNGEELYGELTSKRFASIGKPNKFGHCIVNRWTYYEDDEATSFIPVFGKKYKCRSKYGVADLKGNILIPLEYDEIYEKEDGSYSCQVGNKRRKIQL